MTAPVAFDIGMPCRNPWLIVYFVYFTYLENLTCITGKCTMDLTLFPFPNTIFIMIYKMKC